ncbi:MAG: GNAT family protein [Candidatus Omnitrophota bacterium]
MRPVFLKGKNILLCPLSKKHDLGAYASWLNDQETTLFMGSGRFPVTVTGLKAYIDSYNKSKDGILLGIFLKKGLRHIGNITLNGVDWKNRHGEIGIIIGDKKVRGKGYGTEAIKLIVEHAFAKLNLHKLYTGMVEGNEASRKAFKKSGFKEEAVLKEHFYLNGEYLNYYRLGLLKAEFKK